MAGSEARRRRARNSRGRGTKRTHTLSMIVVTGVVAMMLVVVGVGAAGLKEKKALLESESLALEEQIAKEENRTLEIEEYGKEVQTKKYYEQVAKEKLGLVHEDEILFKKQD